MHDVWSKKRIIAPSLICLDLCNLESQVRVLEDAGIDVLHVDILDGHFSPSMPIGLSTVRQLKERTSLKFDVHLMTKDPEYFISELLDIGVEQISFQIESAEHIDGMLNRIHSAGIRAGVALKPATPLSTLDYILQKCDNVLLMLINPGYASSESEQQVPYAERKIRELSELITARNLKTNIEIDGRVSPNNVASLKYPHLNTFVVGSTCIKRGRILESMKELGVYKE